MGKKHSKEDSKARKEKQVEKRLRAKRKQMLARCRFLTSQMHEAGRNHGFVSWLGFRPDDEEPVVLRANFVQNGRVLYPVLDQFISDLNVVSKTYVMRMTQGSLDNDNPENIVRSMATVLWNQVNNPTPVNVDSELDEEKN